MLKRLAIATAFALLVPATSIAQDSGDPSKSDDEIAKAIIAESIAAYSGSCACPYSTMSNGHRCGKRSAYSKPGGASPICYRRDVTDDMIARYRAR